MRRREDDGAEGQARHAVGLVARGEDGGEAEVAFAADVRAPEAGAEGHVGEEVERRAEGAARGVEAEVEVVPVGGDGELGAEEGGFGGDAEAVAGAGGFIEHAGGEGGEAGEVAVEAGAALHAQGHLHQRHFVHGDHAEGGAVGEPGLLDGGEREAGGRRHRRDLGAVEALGAGAGGEQQRGRQGGQASGGRRHGVPSTGVAASSGLPCGTTLRVTRGWVR